MNEQERKYLLETILQRLDQATDRELKLIFQYMKGLMG